MPKIRIEIFLPDEPRATFTVMYVNGERQARVAEIDIGITIDEAERRIGKPHIDKIECGELMWIEFNGDVRYETYDCGVPLERPLRTAIIENIRGIKYAEAEYDSEECEDR